MVLFSSVSDGDRQRVLKNYLYFFNIQSREPGKRYPSVPLGRGRTSSRFVVGGNVSLS